MVKWLMKTDNDVTTLVLRIALAAVFFPHGAQKALGWFGGPGFSATVEFFTAKMGIPLVLALLIIAAEFLGSIGLFLGLLARIASFGIFCVMAGAVALVHSKVGFFMNWFGQLPAGKEGFEFHILAMALAFAVIVRGAGPLSLDHAISRNRSFHG